MVTWHLLTGEYPPTPGGVSDYSQLVARGLATAGETVEVWAPADAASTSDLPGMRVHRLTSNFGPRALREIDHSLRRPSRRILLVQYVPHAFGYKAMNVGLCRWLAKAGRRERVWIMFHEVCFPRCTGQPLKHRFLSTVQRWMAREVARFAQRRFVATPHWGALLASLGHFPGPTEWLPVPSNITTAVDENARAAVRGRVAPSGGQILGHFGTYAESIRALLTQPLVASLRRRVSRVALLIGRGSEAYAERIRREHPDLGGRVVATGGLGSEPLAAHLGACDLLLQPYPDGAAGRRGSLMAGIALGLPIISSHGPLTEPVWQAYAAVRLVENCLAAWDSEIEQLLSNGEERAKLGRNARRLYQERFAIERTIEVLRARQAEDLSIEGEM